MSHLRNICKWDVFHWCLTSSSSTVPVGVSEFSGPCTAGLRTTLCHAVSAKVRSIQFKTNSKKRGYLLYYNDTFFSMLVLDSGNAVYTHPPVHQNELRVQLWACPTLHHAWYVHPVCITCKATQDLFKILIIRHIIVLVKASAPLYISKGSILQFLRVPGSKLKLV